MKREKSCGCIVFNENKKILYIKMTAGHWGFPKGHVEGDETEQQTALREVLEETGITCSIIKGFRYITSYSPKPNVMKDVVFFVAKALDEDIKIQHKEVLEADFFSLSDVLDRATFKNDKDILLKAVPFINQHSGK